MITNRSSASLDKADRLGKNLTTVCEKIASLNLPDHEVIDADRILKLLSQQLQARKPILVLASPDADLVESLQQVLVQECSAIAQYEMVLLTLPRDAQQAASLIDHWHCDVWCVVQEASTASQEMTWALPATSDYPGTQTACLVREEGQWMTDLSEFCKTLEKLVKRKPEVPLVDRITAQLRLQSDRVQSALATQAAQLNSAIQATEAKLNQVKPTADVSAIHQAEQDLQGIMGSISQQIKDLKAGLGQSKEALLDSYYRYSLVHQIQAFTESLSPVVVRRGGSQYVQLQTNTLHSTVDVNLDLIHLCYSYLNQWAIDQWHALSGHPEFGTQTLRQKVEWTLRRLPQRSGAGLPIGSMPLKLTFQGLLPSDVAGTTCEAYYKEVSAGHYILRQLRSQWMGIMFLSAFAGMIGLSSQGRNGVIKALIQPLMGLPPWAILLILIGVFCPIFLLLFRNHESDSTVKLEAEAEKLRKRLFDYYRKFAEQSVAKILKVLDAALDEEEKQIQQTIVWGQSQIAAAKAEAEQGKRAIQQEIDALCDRQKSLQTIQTELQNAVR